MADGGRRSSARERRRGSGRGREVEWGAGREAGQLGQGAGQGLAEAASGRLGAECLSSSDGRESGVCACSMEQQVSRGAGDHGSSGACLMGHHGRAASRRGVHAQRRCSSGRRQRSTLLRSRVPGVKEEREREREKRETRESTSLTPKLPKFSIGT